MSTSDQHSQLPESELSLLHLLGLRLGDHAAWDEIRAAQLQAVGRFALMRLAGGVLAIILTLKIFADIIAPWELRGWVGIALLASVSLGYSRYRRRAEYPHKAPADTIRRDALMSLVLGLIWTIPPLFFAPQGDWSHGAQSWTVSTTLLIGVLVGTSSLPASIIAMTVTITLANIAMTLLMGYPVAALTTLLAGFGLLIASISSARDFIRFKTVQTAIVEKTETVSLLLREFEDSGADWLWQIDASRRLTHVSPRFAIALGREPEQIEGKPLVQLLAGDTWESGRFASALHDLAEKLNRRESFSNLLLPVKIGEETHWWELSASPRLDENGRFMGFRGVGSDVTLEQASAAKIDRLARFDSLTGLPNRLQVTEALAKAIEHSAQWKSRCAFMMIDLDRFKAINDTLGHPVGDRLLELVSARLTSIITDNELCGRLGGDEFAVVVRDVPDTTYLDTLAHRIITTLSRPYDVDKQTLYIGASVGSAVAPRDARTFETLIRSADLALYRAKDKGGNHHYAYDPGLHVQAEERRVIEIALRKALERGEFHLNYQPVVSAHDGTIDGFEALVRWTNPDLGSVSPAKFIPIAEDARLIGQIGEWVLRTACHEAMNWPQNIRVAVNVSAEQLADPNFATSVVSALSHSGLPPRRLELEVTESVFMRDGGGASQMLDQLLGLGLRLSLDDFGTGYSSLGYLRKTRFSTIKVDRSFVQGAARNKPESLAIIRAVVAMADSLGMSTTAEGAETEAEVEMIRRLGCKKIQGFYFGRPMPANDAADLFRDREEELNLGYAS